MVTKKANYKLKHWRGVLDENSLRGSTVLVFYVVVLGK